MIRVSIELLPWGATVPAYVTYDLYLMPVASVDQVLPDVTDYEVKYAGEVIALVRGVRRRETGVLELVERAVSAVKQEMERRARERTTQGGGGS
jgi:hypothetical protein